MKIHRFELGPLQVAAYVVETGGEALWIDAPQGAEEAIAFCRGRDLVPRLLVCTHAHADHIYANRLVRETWPEIEIACGAGDVAMMTSPLRNLSPLMGAWVKSPPPDRRLADGDEVIVGEARFEVLETPGHTAGGISLYAPTGPDGPGVVFTGDALFAGGIGRTDFPGADHAALIASIRRKLLTLPAETVVYPGHGPPTSIGRESEANPWLDS